MSKLIYKMGGVSADGYIVGPDGKFDWGVPDEELHRFHNDEARALGGHLLGRRLYETMLYWETAALDPEAGEIQRDFASVWQAMPKVVFSRTLESVEGVNMSLARRDLPSELAELRQTVSGDLGIGGARLAGDAIRQGLVDEFQLLVYPVSLGGGIPFFPRDCRLELELLETRTFNSRVAYLRYRAIYPTPS
ncbi:MAG: dihydrofolate reductase family protein [Candidatus Eremiobacteraeota bacterium]|nr:dihydrofolate reductase family protein [Candidatus Eremiobacteraeota bacterium]MCW5872134.1 dihydrofolate reductase family protein [Candidatus Eremiobacteraeota bacterium]